MSRYRMLSAFRQMSSGCISQIHAWDQLSEHASIREPVWRVHGCHLYRQMRPQVARTALLSTLTVSYGTLASGARASRASILPGSSIHLCRCRFRSQPLAPLVGEISRRCTSPVLVKDWIGCVSRKNHSPERYLPARHMFPDILSAA